MTFEENASKAHKKLLTIDYYMFHRRYIGPYNAYYILYIEIDYSIKSMNIVVLKRSQGRPI